MRGMLKKWGEGALAVLCVLLLLLGVAVMIFSHRHSLAPVQNMLHSLQETGHFSAQRGGDIKLLQEGDPCPVCGQPVKSARSIEVGQVFKLFDKYSKALGLTYKDENQEDQLVQMGCYGIGCSRTMQAVVEQHHDDNGIIWPMSVAPYHVIIDLVGIHDETQVALAEDLYAKLQKAGVEVILDDRDERPGVKFKDADLIGIPIRIVVGKKAADGIVEYKLRRGGDVLELSAEEALAKAVELVNAERYGK